MLAYKEASDLITKCVLNGEDIPLECFADEHIFKAQRRNGKYYTADNIEIPDPLYKKFYAEIEVLHPLEQAQLRGLN